MKNCSKCKKLLLYEDFYTDRNNKLGLTSQCKTCTNIRGALWKKNNPDKVSIHSKKYWSYPKNKERRIKNEFKRTYGISYEEKIQMLKEQKYKCAICRTNIPDLTKAHLDHDHHSNKIRAILCGHCNVGLGMFKDDIRLLISARNYLNKYIS